ncbi:TSUP family transporter [Belnapia sp. T18]|uniref:Probable membrane transporter protein n=1 Tax=Belnapia arida TaxID=2804533 RepID=A0ABS1U040_9PROT|nr:TSUP family transporter [Belnapia arida]MBL6078049.1 TSUP family transporter [Belnapia arida]
MTPLAILLLCCVMLGTAFLSGIFGMAGGLVLIGVLLALLPLPEAMALHAVTQIASNFWRGLLWRKHILWRPLLAVGAGFGLALLLWSLVGWVPDKPLALLALGITPFLVKLMPARLAPDPHSPAQGLAYGTAAMSLMLLTGVSGPLIDRFFLGRKEGGGGLDRRQIVATKAAGQILGHALKLGYFGGLASQTASLDWRIACAAVLCSILGTTLARRILEAMTDTQYRRWTDRLIAAVSGTYILYGITLLALPE